MAAVVALIHMPTECCGSAHLNGTHGPELIAGHLMGFSVVRAVLTEYIRHLDAAKCPHRSSLIKEFPEAQLRGKKISHVSCHSPT